MYAKLIRMLRHAHAAEYGAWWAYKGHMESLTNNFERSSLMLIMSEENRHIEITKKMLADFNAHPGYWQPKTFIGIGKVLGFLCKYTGYRLPMFVAGLIEKIGKNSYRAIAAEAKKVGQPLIELVLLEMAETEEEHEEFFKERLKK
jgi:demethoxyubiquinone hydroxylase (CLK1/Coq7/Cat5 family)